MEAVENIRRRGEHVPNVDPNDRSIINAVEFTPFAPLPGRGSYRLDGPMNTELGATAVP
jgi:hypothetical protein